MYFNSSNSWNWFSELLLGRNSAHGGYIFFHRVAADRWVRGGWRGGYKEAKIMSGLARRNFVTNMGIRMHIVQFACLAKKKVWFFWNLEKSCLGLAWRGWKIWRSPQKKMFPRVVQWTCRPRMCRARLKLMQYLCYWAGVWGGPPPTVDLGDQPQFQPALL